MQNSEPDKGVIITLRGSYPHITHPLNFVILSQDIDLLWANLFQACRQHNCRKILNEGNVDLSKLRAFDSYNAGAQAGEIEGLRMAWLFHDYVPDERAEFFKTVAANRGAKVEFFTDRARALERLGVEATE